MDRILKSYKLIITVTFVLLFFCSSQVFAGYQTLNNLKFEAKINIDGSMEVKEIWDVYISETNTMLKYFEKDDSKYSGITDVKVREITRSSLKEFENINEWQYHVAKDCYYGTFNDDGNFEIGWGVALDNSSATRTYEIEYKVLDVITKANDCAELYWQFIGDDNTIFIDNLKGVIELPASGLPSDYIKVWGHTEGLNGTIYPYTTDNSISNNAVEFNLENVYGGNMVEVRVLFPSIVMFGNVKKVVDEDILDKVVDEETVWAEEANARREELLAKREKQDKITSVVSIIIGIILSIFSIKGIKKSINIIKTEKKFKPIQELEYFRDMPRENATPLEARSLVKFNFFQSGIPDDDIGKIFLATILNLNLKNFLEFKIDNSRKKEEQVIIEIFDKDKTELEKEDERAVYEFLKDMKEKGIEITSKSLKKYIQNHVSEILILKDKFYNSLIENLEKENLLDKENKKKATNKSVGIVFKIMKTIFLFVFGMTFIISSISNFSEVFKNVNLSSTMIVIVIITIISSLLEIILDIIAANRINVLTQNGVDEKEKWKGLVKYMEEFSLLKEREIPEIAIWEKYLVYATVFGIAKEVIKQLRIVYPEIESMTNTNLVTTNLLLSSNFNDTFTNVINSSISSVMSSGSGSGGGFSGGGGGGRRRWRYGWPLIACE